MGVWSKINQAREEIYQAFSSACQSSAVQAKVLKSDDYVHPAAVKFECWIPQYDRLLTERAMVLVTFEPKPFHRYEVEYRVEIDNRGHKKNYPNLLGLDPGVAAAIVSSLLHGKSVPSLNRYRARRVWFQFWRPHNKVEALKPDLAMIANQFLLGLGVLTATFVVGVFLIAAAALFFYLLSRRYRLVRNSGRPESEPRTLLRVDSWQTVMTGLGDAADSLRQRFLQLLHEPDAEHFRQRVEHISYWSQDGLEEREQIVLQFNRGIVFCQIYQYDHDLYVGWDGHLNLGVWVEKKVATGVDRLSGKLVQVNTVESGVERVTEYDITDLSCLMERTHAKLTRLVKELMEERKIEQEVDFRILRGERQDLTRERKVEESKGKRGMLGMLKRTG